jgi:hypothetical protein
LANATQGAVYLPLRGGMTWLSGCVSERSSRSYGRKGVQSEEMLSGAEVELLIFPKVSGGLTGLS